MNTTEALRRFEETVQVYLQELDGFSMEELKYRQAEDEWSIGQMYQHLIQSALSMHLRNIELCLNPIEDAAVFSAEKRNKVWRYSNRAVSRRSVFRFRRLLNIRRSDLQPKSS